MGKGKTLDEEVRGKEELCCEWDWKILPRKKVEIRKRKRAITWRCKYRVDQRKDIHPNHSYLPRVRPVRPYCKDLIEPEDRRLYQIALRKPIALGQQKLIQLQWHPNLPGTRRSSLAEIAQTSYNQRTCTKTASKRRNRDHADHRQRLLQPFQEAIQNLLIFIG